jgi:hypothetical protein
MTKDELREAIGLLSYLDPGHIVSDEQYNAIILISKVSEGVLRFPENKDLLYKYPVLDRDGYHIRDDGDYRNQGYNQCLIEVKKALNLEEKP